MAVQEVATEEHPAINSILGANPFIDLQPKQLMGTLVELGRFLTSRPDSVMSRMVTLMIDLMQIALGNSEIAPQAGDKRFADSAFAQHPIYKRLMQTYLAWRSSLLDLVEEDQSIDWKDAEQLRFATMLITEALAPTNVLMGNPAAIKHAFDSAGTSLMRGMHNFFEDVINNRGMPSQVDKRPFEVGRNLGVTPGEVISRGDLCEVIQYEPRAKKVFARPLLMIPPQINKFYIMDLAPKRSLVEYALDHGVQVFTISWRNPTAALRDKSLDDYVEACEKAMAIACEVSGSPNCNVLGICAGGITMSLTLGHLAAIKDTRVNAGTLLVTMLDSQPSMTGMFATEEIVADAIARSQKKGVLAGADMARVFAWLRPNDLVWNYWVNNYLMGEQPPAFDILYWNSDSTNLPAGLHEGFLKLFLSNPLAKPGAIEILGTPIDLRRIKSDMYLLAGQTDHICTWHACYRATQLFGGKVEFVLNSSGHVQSLVSPPGNPKAHYFTNSRLPEDSDLWLRGATDKRGTWWDHWLEWLGSRSGEERPAPGKLGNSAYPAIGPAPGSYVLERH
jgi:poly[(R)-3-hydroxyalkanoate] polymerase subunit PhaC